MTIRSVECWFLSDVGEFSLFYTATSVHIFMECKRHFSSLCTLFVYISTCGPPISTDIHQPTVCCWNILIWRVNVYRSCCWFFYMEFEPAVEQFVEIAVISSFPLVVEDTLVFALLKFLAVGHWCAERVVQRTLTFDLHETPIPFAFERLIEESFRAKGFSTNSKMISAITVSSIDLKVVISILFDNYWIPISSAKCLSWTKKTVYVKVTAGQVIITNNISWTS